jgi:hypothetical protein
VTRDVPAAKLGGIFKRMETDAEYILRLRAAGKRPPVDVYGALLDAHGDAHGIQRRIVESTT